MTLEPQPVAPPPGFLQRVGGMVLWPRATLSAVDPVSGRRDGLLLALAYVAGTQVMRLAGGAASAVAAWDLNGGLMLLQAAVRAFVPPLLALFLVEGLLGARRSYRSGMFLAPMVLVGTAGHLLSLGGVDLPGYAYLPELVGAAWGAVAAYLLREVVAPEAEADA